ncbi:uncharacterized protein ACLA_070890 [Aspergillus clavatus NRRL 1]|uniref:Uncharacterized protein n=1 Tax=Aspergillus clavatus (strain ATCC 1007 / CBS 513.65 / DSM 816 / NCTC 3887 / NRRL 1 / QM 1276 / 107) TaxID=344612 RepID=A1C6N5_ASPCL|nr:uncharacterized protein ACLA_070890 [Aspergillus clavatus NRRL 1]EAW14056.1 conserved hypothetical protein [Aspergillus clavatus NRRL 1]
MHFTTSFVLMALLSIFGASAVPLSQTPNPALTWHVSDFSTGCSPGGCVYRFNILGIAAPNTPGFNTTCNGTDVQEDYAFCQDKHIKANVIPLPYPLWKVDAIHAWFKSGAEFYAEGSANVTSSMENFTIPVTRTYGVA